GDLELRPRQRVRPSLVCAAVDARARRLAHPQGRRPSGADGPAPSRRDAAVRRGSPEGRAGDRSARPGAAAMSSAAALLRQSRAGAGTVTALALLAVLGVWA